MGPSPPLRLGPLGIGPFPVSLTAGLGGQEVRATGGGASGLGWESGSGPCALVLCCVDLKGIPREDTGLCSPEQSYYFPTEQGKGSSNAQLPHTPGRDLLGIAIFNQLHCSQQQLLLPDTVSHLRPRPRTHPRVNS